MSKKKFTLGFIFTPDLRYVLLLHKNRPEKQKGRLNGLGGKVEEGESCVACIAREVKEESGLEIPEADWIHAGEMYGDDWHVDVFISVYKGDMHDAKRMEDQEVEWFEVNNLPDNIMDHLDTSIPLCIARLKNKDAEFFNFEYID